MAAKLYCIEATVEVYYLAEDGKAPGFYDMERAVREEMGDNPQNIDASAAVVTAVGAVSADWIDSVPRGTRDERSIRERLIELGLT